MKRTENHSKEAEGDSSQRHYKLRKLEVFLVRFRKMAGMMS